MKCQPQKPAVFHETAMKEQERTLKTLPGNEYKYKKYRTKESKVNMAFTAFVTFHLRGGKKNKKMEL